MCLYFKQNDHFHCLHKENKHFLSPRFTDAVSLFWYKREPKMDTNIFVFA